jgi:hypothetical protein
MSESIPVQDLLQRYEEVVRENELLRQKVNWLYLGVGHAMVFVELAAAVRRWREDGSDEAKQQMFDAVNEYDRRLQA